MNKGYFLKVLGVNTVLACIFVLVAAPLMYSQVKEVIFHLNLAKNQEQAERLATLISIDLERGEKPNKVLNKVQNMLETTPQSKEHFACIVEDENKVIAHPKPSNVGKDVTGWTIKNELEVKTFTQAAGEGVSFGGIQTRLDGSQDISYQVPISTMPWAVCVHTKLDLIDVQTISVMQQVALISIPALFLLVLTSSFFIAQKVKLEVGSA